MSATWARLHAIIEGMGEEIVACLQTLVRMPSITGNEAAIGEHTAALLRGWGMQVEILEGAPGRPNVLATWEGSEPGPTLLLNDHLDIVPPGPLDAWRHPPFAGVVDAGHVFGRGTIDTKSGLTTILMATQALRASSLPIRGRLCVLLTCDEEVGGALGIQHVAALGRLAADLALVAEPTSMQVQTATKGRMNLEITTDGRATHGARPWLGHNAIEDAAAIIGRLAGLRLLLQDRRHEFLGPASLNVGIVDGGTVPNMVPNRCRIEVDRRLIPGETQAAALVEVQAVLDALALERPGFVARMRQTLWWPGYVLDAAAPVIGQISAAFESVVGHAPVIAGKDAGTDASWIHTLADIPVVMFSPGDGARAMDANESVSIADLRTATAVVARFVHDVLVIPESVRSSG